MNRSRRAAFGAALLAACLGTGLIAGASASASRGDAKAGTKTATFEGGFRNLRLVAPHQIRSGATLEIVNDTDPNKIGPHTFSLVQRHVEPKTDAEQRKCEHFRLICREIGKWHHADPETGTVGVNPVHAGHAGWNRKGNFDHEGDSWFTDQKGQTFSQEVTAKPGRTLWFVCAVHPWLQGKIRVVR